MTTKLDVRFECSTQLWPWSGYLALFLRVKDGDASFSGPAALGERKERGSEVTMQLILNIIPIPKRRDARATRPALPIKITPPPLLCPQSTWGVSERQR